MTLLRISIFALIAFSVLAYGAVEVWSTSVIEVGAVVLLLFWAILIVRNPKPIVLWSPLNWPILGLIVIGLLQLAFRRTAYAFLTETELVKITAYFVLFFLMAQVFRTRRDLSVLAWFLMLFCFGVSLFGILQHFTSGGQIYWLTKITTNTEFFGPFVNRNHFAGFVELTLPVGLGLLVFRGLAPDLIPLVTVLSLVPVSAVILSGSRGGILCLVFEICVLALLVRGRKSEERPNLAVVGIVATAAVALIVWVGAERAIQRFSEVAKGDVNTDRRISMFRGAAGMFVEHPFKGSGLGTMVAAYPRHETLYDGLVVEHVHDDYIELIAETGILGGICGLAFLWLLFHESRQGFESKQGSFSRGLHAGAIAALSGLLLHSFLDFNLHIPSNAMLFLLQACIASSPPLLSDSHRIRRPVRMEQRHNAALIRGL